MPPTAGEPEICDQGLRIAMQALGATGGVILLRAREESGPRLAASAGEAAPLLNHGAAAPGEAVEVVEEAGESRVALSLQGLQGPLGTILLRLPAWDPRASAFAAALARAVASSLAA